MQYIMRIIVFIAACLCLGVARVQADEFSSLPKEVQKTISNMPSGEKVRYLKAYSWENRYNRPIEAYSAARCVVKLSKELGDEPTRIEGYSYIGVINMHLENYAVAMVFFVKARDLALKFEDEVELAYSYNNIGTIYLERCNFSSALKNTRKSFKLFSKLHDTLGIAYNYALFSRIHLRMGNHDSAMYYGNKIVSLGQKILNKEMVARGTVAKGEVYINEGKYEKALSLYLRAYDTAARIFGIDQKIAETYEKMGNYEKATHYSYKYLEISKKYDAIAPIYKALTGLNRIITHGDVPPDTYISLFNSKDSICDVLAKQKFEVAMNSIDLQIEEQQEQAEVDSEKNQQYLVLILGAMTALLMVFVVLKAKSYRDMEFLNESLRKEAARSDAQTQKLNEAVTTKDKFFSIIAHDLRNPLGNFRDVSKMLYDDYAILSNEERLEYLRMQKDSSAKVYELLQNLLEWSRIERGLMKCNPVMFDMAFIVSGCISVLEMHAKRKEINLVSGIESPCMVYGDPNLITTVIRNLMSNAIKFTNKGGVILIDKLRNSDDPMEQKFFVRDNGVGITSEVMENIFKVGGAKSTTGTGGECGTGLGLILCKEFIEMHGGRLSVDSEVGKGTSFYFTIPKKNVGSSDVA